MAAETVPDHMPGGPANNRVEAAGDDGHPCREITGVSNSAAEFEPPGTSVPGNRAELFQMLLISKVLRRLGAHNAIYDKEYYERDVEGPACRSAPHIAKSVFERFYPETLIDVGCGTGAMMEAFRDLGVSVLGLEYSNAGIEKCRQRALTALKFNIERDELRDTFRHDVAISTEVAEHLPARVAPKYVRMLCGLAPIVVCTAARPGQGGTDHVNLQPKEYWINLFAKNGHKFDAESTDTLSALWCSNGVQDFYHENLMVFQARD